MDVLTAFHPVVRSWFQRRFAGGATEPQAAGWPAILRGEDVLIAAPTGSGKTLAAFLVCIDRLLRAAEAAGGELPDETAVVYVSPLKALAADVGKNLEAPLAEIRGVSRECGLLLPTVRVQLRSGDTTPAERAAMIRRPPQIVVTTPAMQSSIWMKSRICVPLPHTVSTAEPSLAITRLQMLGNG